MSGATALRSLLERSVDVIRAGQHTSGAYVAAPGFAADCLETLEELGIRGRETFLAGGGKKFALLECLNDSPEGMTMLERLVLRELEGWVPAP